MYVMRAVLVISGCNLHTVTNLGQPLLSKRFVK